MINYMFDGDRLGILKGFILDCNVLSNLGSRE